MLLKSIIDVLNVKNYITSTAGWTRFEFLIASFSQIPLKDCKKANIESKKSDANNNSIFQYHRHNDLTLQINEVCV